METKPKIKPVLSQLDKTLELTSKVLLIGMWILTVYAFLKSPAKVAIHYAANGQVDKYGSRFSLLIPGILATVIYFVLTELNKHPHLFNYGIRITADNVHKQYTLATRMLRFLKVSILLIFLIIILFTHLTSIGITKGLGGWFLPIVCGLLIVPTIVLVVRALKNGNSMRE